MRQLCEQMDKLDTQVDANVWHILFQHFHKASEHLQKTELELTNA